MKKSIKLISLLLAMCLMGSCSFTDNSTKSKSGSKTSLLTINGKTVEYTITNDSIVWTRIEGADISYKDNILTVTLGNHEFNQDGETNSLSKEYNWKRKKDLETEIAESGIIIENNKYKFKLGTDTIDLEPFRINSANNEDIFKDITYTKGNKTFVIDSLVHANNRTETRIYNLRITSNQ